MFWRDAAFDSDYTVDVEKVSANEAKITVKANSFAKAVFISFKDNYKYDFSDNYLNVEAGESVTITVTAKDGIDLDELELELIDFGVEELGHDEEEGTIVIYGDFNQYSQMQKYLEDNGFEIQSCEFVRIPNDTKTLSDEEMESVQKLIDRIEEDEDVQNVFTNLG